MTKETTMQVGIASALVLAFVAALVFGASVPDHKPVAPVTAPVTLPPAKYEPSPERPLPEKTFPSAKDTPAPASIMKNEPAKKVAKEKPETKKEAAKSKAMKGPAKNGDQCHKVPPAAYQYSLDVVVAAAKQYGRSAAEIAALKVCWAKHKAG